MSEELVQSLLQKLAPAARDLVERLFGELEIKPAEVVAEYQAALIITVLGENPDGIDQMWRRICAGPDGVRWALLRKRVEAIRKYGEVSKVRTHDDVDLLLDAKGVDDSTERAKVHRGLARMAFESEHGKERLESLETEKTRSPVHAEEEFPRRFAEKNPWIGTDSVFRETADVIATALREHDLFFDELRTRRPDLYRVQIWIMRAVDEAQRIDLGMSARKEERTSSREGEIRDRLLDIMQERDKTRNDLLRRGIAEDSDDFERVMNVFEARLRAVVEDDQ